jgi:glycerol transport system ATP-binding protein
VTEITGSESCVHLDFNGSRWVMLSHGILALEPDETVDVYIDPRHLMLFDMDGRAVRTPARKAA